MVKSAVTMFAYAVAMVVVGYTTFMVAPPGSKNPITALIVPLLVAGLMGACGVMSLMIGSKRSLGLLGSWGGLVLPLLVAVAIAGGRLPKSLNATGEFNAAVEKAPVAVAKERGDVPKPTGYQSAGMMGMVALSGFAFVVLLMYRPELPAKSVSEPVSDAAE